MKPYWRSFVGILMGLSLAGCPGLSMMQQSILQFDQGAHSLSTSEMNYFIAVQSVDCTAGFYLQAINWANGPGSNFDISGVCTPTILTDAQIKTRQALMDALTLYADKMAALASPDSNKALDANSQKLAENLNALAKQQKFSDLSLASSVEAAIIAISEMALDQKKFKEIKTAAKEMNPHLTAVVSALEIENNVFAQGIGSKLDSIEMNLRPLVASQTKSDPMSRLMDVVEARHIMQTANPFGTVPLTKTEGAADPSKDPNNVALRLNKALDSMLNANKAIANAGTGGIIAAANDLIARAQAAQRVQSSLNK